MRSLLKKIFTKILKEVLIILLFVMVLSCKRSGEKPERRTDQSGISVVTRAERIKIKKNEGYTTVSIINPWQGANEVNQEYYLVKRGLIPPDTIDTLNVIFVPVKKIICMSTTHIAMISELGEENTIAGISGIDFPYSERVNENIRKGMIVDVGYEASLNKELIIKITPDLVMMYGIGSESSTYSGKIKELGIHILFNADYLETDPLGKAEWIKLFGALYCKESLADSIFNSEIQKYDQIKNYVSANIKTRPSVLLGLPFRDIWYISPGNSFISKMIDDAGGNYLWRNSVSSVSMPLGIENVFMKALDADYWLNIGTIKSKSEIYMVDPRLTDLPCFRKGNLYNSNYRTTVNGGNDYWESGTVHPHLILKDIASILHPELFEQSELFFYRKIE